MKTTAPKSATTSASAAPAASSSAAAPRATKSAGAATAAPAQAGAVAAPRAPTLSQPAGSQFRAPSAPSMTPKPPVSMSKRADRAG